MKFMFLIHPGPEGPQDRIEDHVTFARTLVARGAYVTSDALESPDRARTVRVRDGKPRVSDGPFAEAKEALGGFYVLECADLDEAIAYAAQIPSATHGSVEVRPVMDIPNWDESIGFDRTGRPRAATR
jgi:hypothetical protein